MPSLMAELGTAEPSFSPVVIGVAVVAIALGMAPTSQRLRKRSVAVLSRRRDGDNPFYSLSIGNEDLSPCAKTDYRPAECVVRDVARGACARGRPLRV